MHIVEPFIRESVSTTGTGTSITTTGAIDDCRTLDSVMSVDDTCDYYIEDQGVGREEGILTKTAASTFTRSVRRSTNSNNPINLSGSAKIGIGFPGNKQKAREAIQVDREVLTADRTYFVDGTNGSDSNDGLSSGSAFSTIQKAIDTVAALDLSIYDVTIDVAAGTYTEQNEIKAPVGSGKVIIEGDIATPSNVVIHVTGSSSTHACLKTSGMLGEYELRGLTLQTTTNGRCLLIEGTSSIVTLGEGMVFGNCANVHIFASNGAVIRDSDQGYEISGDASRHWQVQQGASLQITAITITLSGTPNFSNEFVSAALLGIVTANSLTFSGSATGKRYDVNSNAVVYTAGGGASYFPGNSAGSSASGGQYV